MANPYEDENIFGCDYLSEPNEYCFASLREITNDENNMLISI